MKIITICIAVFCAAVLISCTNQETLESLKAERDKKLVELDALNEKISKLDTLDIVGVTELLVTVDTATVTTFIHQIEVQGTIDAESDVLLNAESGGLIRVVNVKNGQRVSKGQVLVQIDASMIAASINEVKTALDFAQYNYDKQKQLSEQGLGTEFQLQQAKSQVDNLKSQMNSLNTQQGKFVITAPFSGVVDQVYAKVGAMAGPQSPILRLVDNREVKVLADVSERLYGRLALGMAVNVQVPSLNDTTIPLSINQIGNYIHPTNRTFRVQATLKNNKLLLPNMLTKMLITDYVNENALVVPAEAVLIDRVGNNYVFVVHKDGNFLRAKRVNVVIRESFNGVSEIEPNDMEIKSGTRVVVKGARGLSDNDFLKII